jgi:dihydroflavonol-4-reductase
MVTVVTGATGFIGGALVEELVRRGENVRALVRKTSNTSRLETLNVEIAYGDLQDRASLEAALNSCDCLYHAAAIVMGHRSRLFYEVNVSGTRNLLEAALKTGVKRVIYTSTAATLCPERGGVLTEEVPRKRQSLGKYADSKWLAEQEAFKLHEKGLSLVSIHPTNVYGPGSMSGWNNSILDFLIGKMPGVPKLYTNLVFINDVVQGHILGFEKGKEGQRYLIAGEDIEVAQVMELAAEMAGLQIKARRLPAWLVLAFSNVGEMVAKVTKKPPLVSRDEVRTLAADVTVDNSRTKRELGYTPTDLREGLAKSILWLQQSGYLPHGHSELPLSR